MDQKYKKKLVLSLIKNDLINYKLVSGLNNLGLTAANYSQDLSDNIFELMGYDQDIVRSDAVFDKYISLCKKVKEVDTTFNNNTINPLALEIYNYLNRRKPRNQNKRNERKN